MNPEQLLVHADFVRSLARSLVLDEHRAADLSQATWLSMFKHPPAQGKPVRPWLVRVLRNLAVSSYRTESRRKRREQAVAMPVDLPSTEEVVEKMETRRLLIEAVLSLDEPYRSTIVFRFYDGLSSREISERLGMPLETIRTREKRGLDQLRKRLDHLHDNDRNRWCQALIPLAGLNLAKTSTLPLIAAIKLCLVLAAAATLIISITMVFDRNEPPRIEDESADDPLAVGIAEQDSTQAGGVDREPLPPVSDSLEMPLTFRNALVGYRGRVIDSQSEPLPGKAVRLLPLGPLDLFRKSDLAPRGTISAEDGTFCIEDIDPRSYCFLQVTGEGIRFVDIQPNPGEIADLGDVMVKTGNVLTGRVQDVEGNPLSGVRVRATQLPPLIFNYAVQDIRKGSSILFENDPLYQKKSVVDLPEIFFELFDALPFPSAITAKDGFFRLTDLPFGPVTLVADKGGYIPQSVGTVISARKKEHEPEIMTLNQGVLIKGRVLDNLDMPVPGAEVRVGPASGNPHFSVLQPPVTTNEEGFFVKKGVSLNLTHAALRRSPGDPWYFPAPFFPESAEHIFHLPPTVEVQVITGAKNAMVKIREKTFQNLMLPFVSNALESAERLFPGLYELQVAAPGYSTAYKTVTLRDSAVVEEVTLEQALDAVIHVKTGKGNAPLAWSEVFAMPKDGDLFRETSKLRRCRTDESGSAHIQDLAPGRYLVTVSHPGYALSTTRLEVPGQETVDVPMKAGGILEGKVHLQGTFTLILECLAGEGNPEFLMPRFFVTDPDGCFRVANLHPGMWKVDVMGRLFGKRPLELFEIFLHGPLAQRVVEVRAGETHGLDILPDESSREHMASVSGSVLLDGIPVRGAEVNLKANGKSFTFVTNAGGVYNLSHVPPGSHRLEARIPPELKLERVIRVEEDLPFHEDFHLLTGTLFGRVEAHSDARPLGGVQVRAWVPMDTSPLKERLRRVIAGDKTDLNDSAFSLFKNAYTTPVEIRTATNPDGTFRFEKAPVGVYKIMTEKKGFGNMRIEAVLVEHNSDTGPVVIKVRSPVMVLGRVELPQEIGKNHDLSLIITPVDYDLSSLVFRGVLEERLIVPVDKKTCTFEIKDIVPGRYKVSFSITSYNRSNRWEGKTIESVKFEVPASGTENFVLNPEVKE